MKQVLLMLLGLAHIINSYGQETGQLPGQHDHTIHDHATWEIGIASGAVSILSEGAWSWGFHLHLVRGFEKMKKIRVGIGAENVFDEHTHLNLNGIIQYQIYKGLGLSVSPGMLFIKENRSWERYFSSHFEIMYEFEIKNIHIGPLVEYSLSKPDQHLLLGVHLGYAI